MRQNLAAGLVSDRQTVREGGREGRRETEEESEGEKEGRDKEREREEDEKRVGGAETARKRERLALSFTGKVGRRRREYGRGRFRVQSERRRKQMTER